jgi:hypothetical protein
MTMSLERNGDDGSSENISNQRNQLDDAVHGFQRNHQNQDNLLTLNEVSYIFPCILNRSPREERGEEGI